MSTFVSKKVFRFEDLEFWAEGGRVIIANIKNADDPSKTIYETFRSVEPKEFLRRAIAIWVMNQKMPSDFVKKVNQLRENAEFVVKEAIKQAEKLQTDNVIIVPSKPALAGVRYSFKHEDPRKVLLDGYQIIAE